jgi:hypothetical protein
MSICTVKSWFEVLVVVLHSCPLASGSPLPDTNALAASCAGLAAILQFAVLSMPVCRAFA